MKSLDCILLRAGVLALSLGGFHDHCAHAASDSAAEVYTIMGPLGGLALQANGKIVVANGFSVWFINTNSGTMGRLAGGAFRFNQDGELDRSFSCPIEPVNFTAPTSVHLTSGPEGKLFMTGTFSKVDNKLRPGYAMLRPDGHLDEFFVPWRDDTNPPPLQGVGAGVYWATALSSGQVAVSSRMRDGPYTTVYRLDLTGRCLPPESQTNSANSPAHSYLWLMSTLSPTGFWVQRPIDWSRTTGTEWPDWPPVYRTPGLPFALWGESPSAADAADVLKELSAEVPLEMCRYAARLPTGGAILAVREAHGSRLIRFDQHWLPDLRYTNYFDVDINSDMTLVLQPDGKLLVAGSLSQLNGEPFTGLARLDPTGATDHSFHCQMEGGPGTAGRATVMSIGLQTDGHVLIAGFFSKVNGVPCPYLARLNPDGSIDEVFQHHFISFEGLSAWHRVPVRAVAVAPAPGQATTKPELVNPRIGGGSPPAPEPPILITSLEVKSGTAIIQFRGISDQTYILQARNALETGRWFNVGTNQTGAAGLGALTDAEAGAWAVRFYRVVAPH
jgi:uncharacterized delta-60 repeat protein